MTENPIPDSTILSGRTSEGINVSVPAAMLRNPCFKPELKGVKLFVGLPVYQKVDTFFMQCLIALQAQKPCPMEVHLNQGDGIARSRNILTSEFLKSDCTHLLFIDCDLIFNADHITRILSHKLPIVGGFYPKKQQGTLEWVLNTLPGNPPKRADDLQPVKYIGTGFICIAREVFEKMAVAYPETKYREDYGNRWIAHDFWSMAPHGPDSPGGRLVRLRTLIEQSKAQGQSISIEQLEVIVSGDSGHESRYLSEDWFFCQRWNELGGEVFGDCQVILRHIGTSIFPLATQEPEIVKPIEPDGKVSVNDEMPKHHGPQSISV